MRATVDDKEPSRRLLVKFFRQVSQRSQRNATQPDLLTRFDLPLDGAVGLVIRQKLDRLNPKTFVEIVLVLMVQQVCLKGLLGVRGYCAEQGQQKHQGHQQVFHGVSSP